jgi:hypothetical protein
MLPPTNIYIYILEAHVHVHEGRQVQLFSQYLLSALSNWLSYSFRLLYKDSNISKDLSGMELT